MARPNNPFPFLDRLPNLLLASDACKPRSLAFSWRLFFPELESLESTQPTLTAVRRHVTATSAIARELAYDRGDENPEEVALAGFFHLLGVLFYFQEAPKIYSGLLERAHTGTRSLLELEREYFQVDHAELAGQLLKRHGVPTNIADAVGLYPSDLPPKDSAAEVIWRTLRTAKSLAAALGCDSGLENRRRPLSTPDRSAPWLTSFLLTMKEHDQLYSENASAPRSERSPISP